MKVTCIFVSRKWVNANANVVGISLPHEWLNPLYYNITGDILDWKTWWQRRSLPHGEDFLTLVTWFPELQIDGWWNGVGKEIIFLRYFKNIVSEKWGPLRTKRNFLFLSSRVLWGSSSKGESRRNRRFPCILVHPILQGSLDLPLPFPTPSHLSFKALLSLTACQTCVHSCISPNVRGMSKFLGFPTW